MESDEIDDDSAKSETEHVGYKSPPKTHRFKPGRSGNPHGRPKGARSRRQIYERVLLEKRTVDLNANGRPRELTTLELVVLRLRQDALQGRTRAFKEYKTLEAKFGQQESAKKGGYLLIPTVGSWDDWVRLFGPKENPPPQDKEE